MLESKTAEIFSVGVVGFQTIQYLAQQTLKEILIPLESVVGLPISSAEGGFHFYTLKLPFS